MTQSSDILPVGGNAGARLNAFVERIERLNYEIDDLKEDVKEVYAEAKGVGFDVKILRKIIKRRKMDAEKRREEDDMVQIYEDALANLVSMME